MAEYTIDKFTYGGNTYKLQDNESGYTTNTGTVTSVQVQATSPVQSSTSTSQSTSLNTTISLASGYGDTQNPYASKTANYVLAGPTSGSAAVPSFRALVLDDIPDLSSTYSTMKNLVDGSATGSLRGIGTGAEDNNYTIGQYAFAEGNGTYADGNYSHAEGQYTTSTGDSSHAEGYGTYTSGDSSHAEGSDTKAYGDSSHTGGHGTRANSRSQTVIGEYNTVDSAGSASTRGDYAFIIGNGTGTSTSNRSNAFAVDWSGIPYCCNTNNTFDSIFELIYPVGAIYISTVNVNPGTIFGGTWTPIQGRFLVAQGSNGANGAEALNLTAGDTGGEKDHTLLAAEAGVKAHGHTYTRPTVSSSGYVANGVPSAGDHRHSDYYQTVNRGTGNSSTRVGPYGYTTSGATAVTGGNAGDHTHNLPNHTHTLTGGSVADHTGADATNGHNNLPPYLAVYMWERTA